MPKLPTKTSHIDKLIKEVINNPENYNIITFDDKDGNPRIPLSLGCLINSIYSKLEGLYVHGGYIEPKNELEYLYQDYEHNEGYTGYGVVWMKLRFKGPKYVTILVWDRGNETIPIGSHDGEPSPCNEDLLHDKQIAAITPMLEKIVAVKLPNPTITYDIL